MKTLILILQSFFSPNWKDTFVSWYQEELLLKLLIFEVKKSWQVLLQIFWKLPDFKDNFHKIWKKPFIGLCHIRWKSHLSLFFSPYYRGLIINVPFTFTVWIRSLHNSKIPASQLKEIPLSLYQALLWFLIQNSNNYNKISLCIFSSVTI
jgi:hypothetical protein